MIEKEAIREMKKAERIFAKLSKMGYDLDIREGLICLSTNEQTKQMEERLNNTSPHCKPNGFDVDEVIYSIAVC